MYAQKSDETSLLQVQLWSGELNSDDDYQRYLDDTLAIDRAAQQAGRRAAILQIAELGNARPPEPWRKKIDQTMQGLVSKPLVGMVSGEELARKLINAVARMAGPGAPVEMAAFATVEEAVAWLDQGRGGGIADALVHMLAAVRSA